MTSPRALAVLRNRALADTARQLANGPTAAGRLDPAALAVLDHLGLVTSRRTGLLLNCSHCQGDAISCLARGDLARAAGYARTTRPAA
jgi:hypothetical protein